jgi:hypothetical protein
MIVTEGVEARKAGIKHSNQEAEREMMTGSVTAETRNVNGKKSSFRRVGE